MTLLEDKPNTYVIVGAGVFGASTAYHIIKDDSKAQVTLIDRVPFPCTFGASWDFNKVVRADYSNLFYCKLGIEALRDWENIPLFSQFWRYIPIIWLDGTGFGRKIIENYKSLGVETKAKIVGSEDLKGMYNGLYKDTDFEGVDEVFINPEVGIIEAQDPVKAVIEAAVKLGVQYEVADINELMFAPDGSTIGVKAADGRIFMASKVILAAGAYTAKLLADGAPQRSELQMKHRMIATGLLTAQVQLSGTLKEKYENAPIFIHGVGKRTEGEAVTPTRAGIHKFIREASFMNTIQHKASNQTLSAPPDKPEYDQWNVPTALQKEAQIVIDGVYGKEGKDLKFNSYRICWDAFTPNQDFIICHHPYSENLFIATGGSFHGWKFLPVIGKYVLQLLKGTLDKTTTERWAWDRDESGEAHEGLRPRRELSDLIASSSSILTQAINTVSKF